MQQQDEDYDPPKDPIRPLNQLAPLISGSPQNASPPITAGQIGLAEWLNEQTNFRKVVLCNRYYWLTSITSVLITMLRRPYFLVSEHLQHVQNAASSFALGMVDPYSRPAGVHPNAFQVSQVDPAAIIIYEGNFTELERLNDWPGSVIFVVTHGVAEARARIFLRTIAQGNIVRIMWPIKLELLISREDTLMSDYQKSEYRLIRSMEIQIGKAAKVAQPIRPGVKSPRDKSGYESEIMLRSKQRGNVVYPHFLQTEYNKIDKFLRNKSVIKKDLPDSRGGWLNPSIMQYLDTYSPKTLRLIARILSRSGGQLPYLGKYVIVCSFREHHGIDWLSTIFSYQGINTMQLHGKVGKEKAQIVQNFNAQANAVLLMTHQLSIDFYLHNVDEIIIFDGTPPMSVHAIINACFKDGHYSESKYVQVIFEIARLNETQGSADLVYYKEFLEKEELHKKGFDILSLASKFVYFDGQRNAYMIAG